MSPTIRACTEDECGAVLQVWREAEAMPTATDNLDSVTRLVRLGPGVLLVAERDGRIVGTVIAGWDGWRGGIYRLAVVPDYRRRGIGRALVDAAVAWQVERGAQRIIAFVRRDGARAVAFWDETGFSRSDREYRYVLTREQATPPEDNC